MQQRVEELQQHIENLCQQHEEVLLRAENDKQQALLIGTLHFYFYIFYNYKIRKAYFFVVIVAHHDQQALMEKLENALRDLEEEKGNLERLKRDTSIRSEQDRNNLNQLRDNLNRFKTKLDETKLKGDEDRLKLELKIEELLKERESVQKESEELRVQLHMAEDKLDGLHNQLHETVRKLKDSKSFSFFFFL